MKVAQVLSFSLLHLCISGYRFTQTNTHRLSIQEVGHISLDSSDAANEMNGSSAVKRVQISKTKVEHTSSTSKQHSDRNADVAGSTSMSMSQKTATGWSVAIWFRECFD